MKSKILLTALILCFVFSSFSCGVKPNTGAADVNEVNSEIVESDDSGDYLPTYNYEYSDTTDNVSDYDFGGVQVSQDYFSKRDYGGLDFVILTTSQGWQENDINAEQETGYTINDAVYKRNRIVEDNYNVKIKSAAFDDAATELRKVVKSGDPAYSAAFISLSDCASVSSQGFFCDLNKVPYLDLSQPWYGQNANIQLSVGDKLYMTLCDITVRDKDDTNVYLFDKIRLNQLGLDNPYTLVMDGTWTLDKAAEMSKCCSVDIDGDGMMTSADGYGIAGDAQCLYNGLISSNVQIISKDSSNYPQYGGIDDKATAALEKLGNLFGDKATCYLCNPGEDFDAGFTENRLLFYDTALGKAQSFRNSDTDFGILPPPKSDTTQPPYISPVMPSATALCVPVSVGDAERTGTVINMLCAESRKYVMTAYYAVTLEGKFSRDTDSSNMLDIIFSYRQCDIGNIYNFGSLTDIFATAANSAWESGESVVNTVRDGLNISGDPLTEASVVRKSIDKTITMYQALE
ncbi:MAG: hypothetical protein FWD71_14340 [Oscillospiraceae bacterium]|nr:hypothetical protein [Oscillospiraceae bacterium]